MFNLFVGSFLRHTHNYNHIQVNFQNNTVYVNEHGMAPTWATPQEMTPEMLFPVKMLIKLLPGFDPILPFLRL